MAFNLRAKIRSWYRVLIAQLFYFKEPAHIKALSAGIGVFIGLTPFWGLQTVIAVGIAVLFKLNKVLTIATSYISIPPLIPFIIYAQWQAGRFIFAVSEEAEPAALSIWSGSLHYITGSAITAAIGGILAGLIAWMILWLQQRSSKKTSTHG